MDRSATLNFFDESTSQRIWNPIHERDETQIVGIFSKGPSQPLWRHWQGNFSLNSALMPKADPDLIHRENLKEGSPDWQLSRVQLDKRNGFRSPKIEGYCSKQSILAGEVLDIKVSTRPAQEFKIEIFRTGYYGGRGARLMQTVGPLQGKPQPVPKPGKKNLHECQWDSAVSITIPDDWPSGVYLGRLSTLKDKTGFGYWQSYVVFIVKDNRPADILFQCSDNTWQAYNRWPNNYSVYTDPKGNQGPWADVSFDRPYAKYAQIYENPQSVGSGEWLCFEFPFAYWLEKHGYDVTYCSNSDMVTPDHGLNCKSFLSVGHDEYWDIRQYESVVKMRDAGVNLLFFSGNSVCWVTPLLRQYRRAAQPDHVSRRSLWRQVQICGRPRERDNGPFPHRGPDEGYLMGSPAMSIPSTAAATGSVKCPTIGSLKRPA